MCHGSCLAALPNGSLLCVWFGGSREGAADTEIFYSVGTPRSFKIKNEEQPGFRKARNFRFPVTGRNRSVSQICRKPAGTR